MPNPVLGLWFSAKLETVQPSRSSRSGGDGSCSDGGTDALCPSTQETQKARCCLRIEKPSRHEETCIPQAVRARPPQRAHLCRGSTRGSWRALSTLQTEREALTPIAAWESERREKSFCQGPAARAPASSTPSAQLMGCENHDAKSGCGIRAPQGLPGLLGKR